MTDQSAFKAWQATGRDVEDLRAPEYLDFTQLYPEDHPEPVPGRIYDGDFFMERGVDQGDVYWTVTVENVSESLLNLQEAERMLFDLTREDEDS